MKLRTVLLVLFVLLLALFAAVNWSAFAASTTLSLVFTTVEAPLGLVMLGVVTLVALGFLAYMAVWQANVLFETRRYSKELAAQRTLADQAEASRFTELRSYLAEELTRLHQRLDETERTLARDVEASGNTLAAYIGEFEDRMEARPDGATATTIVPVSEVRTSTGPHGSTGMGSGRGSVDRF